ncbi:MAG: polysaccharide ABC transporter ATP-binding protein [Nodosilinea sp.]
MKAIQDTDLVLSVQGVSKKFCRDLKTSLFYGVQDMAQEVLGVRGNVNTTLRKKEFWALQEVSFELRRGETLGLVGKNGSGKSTLLRIIAGLVKPDVGTVTVNGRVAPLIALGAGFNPVLTGRENIYANMSILGLTQEEIDERFEDVVAFAEIGDSIDSPLRSYSSGMQARLGFASAIFTEPEILLIDEVLAVGDSRFRAKCFRKLSDLRQQGTTFILVSHHANSILTVCESSLYLKKGECIGFGDSASIMKKYEEDLFFSENLRASGSLDISPKRSVEDLGLEVQKLFFRNKWGEETAFPETGKPAQFCVACKVTKPLQKVGLSLIIKGLADGGEGSLYLNSFRDQKTFDLMPGEREIRLDFPYLGLKLGTYTLDLFITENELSRLDCIEGFLFSVTSQEVMDRCIFYQPREWSVADTID